MSYHRSKSENTYTQSFECLVPSNIRQDHREQKRREQFLVIFHVSLPTLESFTTIAYYYKLLGFRPHGEIRGLKFGLKFAKSGT